MTTSSVGAFDNIQVRPSGDITVIDDEGEDEEDDEDNEY